MATPSEISKAMDDMSNVLSNARNICKKAKAQISAVKNELDNFDSTFADQINTIENEYTSNDAWQSQIKAQWAMLEQELEDLNKAVTLANNDLFNRKEF
jgi:uncharacterized coiled-coil protein SlyX